MRLFVDTNYLIDCALEDRPGFLQAQQLLGAMYAGIHEGTVAATSLKDFYYITRKVLQEDARRAWIETFLEAMHVESLDEGACQLALRSDEPDYEDACIRAIAERANVDFIITRDAAAFERSFLKTFSPCRFLELFPLESN